MKGIRSFVGLAVCAATVLTACMTAKTMTGSDRDKHGCIRSAGYTWSEVRRDCIRIFESGVRLNDRLNADATMSAFVVFASDSLKAELFIPGKNKGLILKKDGQEWKSGAYRVYRKDGKLVAEGKELLFEQ